MEQSLGIIIPVYNEGANIEATLLDIEQKVHTPHRIYIVYDFDQDNTLPVVKEMQQKGLPIDLLKNPARGVASAIKTGLRNAPNDHLLVTMADLSDDYSVVDQMFQLMLQGYDLICGSRYMKGGKQIGGPLLKKILSRTAGVSLRYIARLPVHDATNSFKLYRKSMVDNIDIQSESGFEIGMEIVIKAHFAGCKITELPCTWTDRQAGSSRFRIFKWMPKYLRWYFYAFKKALSGPIKPNLMVKNKLLKQDKERRERTQKNILSAANKPPLTGYQKFRRNLVITLVFWTIGFLTIPNLLPLSGGGLDNSWKIGLNMARISGLQFGKDIVFTFGPLGFMYLPIFCEFHTWFISAIFNLFVHFLLIQTIVFIMKKFSAGLWDYVLTGIALLLALFITSTEYKLLFSLTILLYFSIVNQSHSKRLLMLCVFVSFLMAVVSLIKFTAMLVSGGILMFMIVFYVYKKQIIPLCCMLFAYTGSILILLVITGQKITNFPAYLLNSYEIAQGYNSAMYISGPIRDVCVGLCAVGLLIFLLVNSILRSKPGLTYFILINTGFVFVSFKYGFIRHDAHVYCFFANMLLVFCCMWITNKNQITLPLNYLSIIIICVLIGFTLHKNPRLIIPDFAGKLKMIGSAASLVTDDAAGKAQILENDKEKLRNAYLLNNETIKYIGNKTVDIMPWEISLLFAYDMKWTPRPVFQCYSAYTDKLDMLNSKYFESADAPEILLYVLSPLDNRYPVFDSPATFRTILINYKPVFIDKKSIILRKADTHSLPSLRNISFLDTEIGKPIAVPKIKNGYLFAKIYMDYNLLGKTAKLLYKPPGVNIRLTSNGNTSECRFILSTARNGIFLSQYISKIRNLFDVWEGKMNNNLDLDSITISTEYPYFYDKNIRVEFFEVPL